MPIAVHCPNPACARVHQVKNKYAGMRGKCPACGSWMYIPVTGQMPSMVVPRPGALDEAAAWAAEEPRAAARKPVGRGPVLAELAEEPPLLAEPVQPSSRGRPRVEERVEEEAAVVAAAEEAVEAEAAPEKPKKHFSWLAVLLLVLGLLSLGGAAAAPFLAGPSIHRTGDFEGLLPSFVKGIDEPMIPYVAGAPGVVAFLAFLCLLIGLVGRQFGFINLALLYLCVIASAALLLAGLEWMGRDLKDAEALRERITKLKDQGKQGEAYPIPGMQYPGIAGGAAGACFFFTLAAVFMHRRWWSRILGFFFLAFFPLLVGAWYFRTQLGIDNEAISNELSKILG
jgi:hypothetical protein